MRNSWSVTLRPTPDLVPAGPACPRPRPQVLPHHLHQQAGGVDQHLVRLKPILPSPPLRVRRPAQSHLSRGPQVWRQGSMCGLTKCSGLSSFWPSLSRSRCTTCTSLFGFLRLEFQECWESWRETKRLWPIPKSSRRVTTTPPRKDVRQLFYLRVTKICSYTRTNQLGHGTDRRPDIIDNPRTFKSILLHKIQKLAREGPDRHPTAFTPWV